MKLAILLFLVVTGCVNWSYVQPEDYEEDDLANIADDAEYFGLDDLPEPGPVVTPKPTPTSPSIPVKKVTLKKAAPVPTKKPTRIAKKYIKK